MKNLILIGMPGAGKSTVGVVLAKQQGYHFVDSDLVIQEQTGLLLHEIIEQQGDDGFRQVENRINADLAVKHSVIATGGSVIDVVEALREAGAEVLGVVSIFTYGMKKGLERLAAADVKNISLTDFDTISQVAVETGYIRESDLVKLKAFRDDPQDESWIEK